MVGDSLSGLPYFSPAGVLEETAAPEKKVPLFPPTKEQQTIIDFYRTGQSFKVVALAGTGKTTLIRFCALSVPERRALYLTFDKASADKATKEMPSNVKARTFHSLALEGVSLAYGWDTVKRRQDISLGVKRPLAIANYLGIKDPVTVEVRGVGDDLTVGKVFKVLTPVEQVRYCKSAIKAFCDTSDKEIEVKHFPSKFFVAPEIFQLAQRMWADICSPPGVIWWEISYYAKIFCLIDPKYSDITSAYQTLFIDEAQDTNNLQAGFYAAQVGRPESPLQKVYVGDSNQAIYQFRGDVDLIGLLSLPSFSLSESFRFGPNIAAAAAKVHLCRTNDLLPLVGRNSDVGSVQMYVQNPDAVIARKNMTVLLIMLEGAPHIDHDVHIHVSAKLRNNLIKLVDTIIWFLDESERPGCVRPESLHSDLDEYENLKEFQEGLKDEPAMVVSLVSMLRDPDERERIIKVIKQTGERLPSKQDLANKGSSKVVELMTTHKSKGGEWGSVQLADDFREPKEAYNPATGETTFIYPSIEELNLIYVACTRAKSKLGLGTAAWIQSPP